jgi:uracil-DNA glycosylase family 4
MVDMDATNREIRTCKKCRLWTTRRNAVPGEGPLKPLIFLLGQAPGRMEDSTGKPFVGMAGRFLDRVLRETGIDRKDAFVTGVLKCFPPKNRPPKWDEINECRPYLEVQLEIIKPKIIVCLGSVAFSALLMKRSKVEDFRGKTLNYKGMHVYVTYHPAAAMRFPRLRIGMLEDLRMVKRDLND